jgi:hypothetical protein
MGSASFHRTGDRASVKANVKAQASHAKRMSDLCNGDLRRRYHPSALGTAPPLEGTA